MSKQNDAQRSYTTVPVEDKRGGPGSAGQSGDTQGLPDVAEAGSESVQELVEEGQYFEAEVLLGVETAEDPDLAEVQTSEVPESRSAAGEIKQRFARAKATQPRSSTTNAE